MTSRSGTLWSPVARLSKDLEEVIPWTELWQTPGAELVQMSSCQVAILNNWRYWAMSFLHRHWAVAQAVKLVKQPREVARGHMP